MSSKDRQEETPAPAGKRWVRWMSNAAAVLLLVAVLGMILPPAWVGMGEITPKALAARLNGLKPLPAIVDVRTGMEFSRGHIDGAVHAPVYFLPFLTGRLPDDKQREVVLVCLSGHRSRLAGLILTAAGYRVRTNLTGGMAAWNAAGLPTRKT